jgi:hypothetical protein
MKSENVLEVEIVQPISRLGHCWIWKTKLNGLYISSMLHQLATVGGRGTYTTPRGAKEAFKRWLKGTGKILYFICPIGHLALKPKVNIERMKKCTNCNGVMTCIKTIWLHHAWICNHCGAMFNDAGEMTRLPRAMAKHYSIAK